ncbi:MAG: PIN domain-containing protein [Cyanobacteria bacterium SBLK]|nr:PIN domain-containing protein [Cyanobacteria bacterium SBLK]
MIYLDTHVVMWLYGGLMDRLSDLAKSLIHKHELLISPMVRLELQYLYEIGRISEKPDVIISDLSDRINLKICEKDFNSIVDRALEISWTRDPFDRLIVANAWVDNNILLTRDTNILANYIHAKWES